MEARLVLLDRTQRSCSGAFPALQQPHNLHHAFGAVSIPHASTSARPVAQYPAPARNLSYYTHQSPPANRQPGTLFLPTFVPPVLSHLFAQRHDVPSRWPTALGGENLEGEVAMWRMFLPLEEVLVRCGSPSEACGE